MAMLEKFFLGKGDKQTHAIWSVSEKKERRKQEKDIMYIVKPKAIRKISSRK